jgi:hypothetical protein
VKYSQANAGGFQIACSSGQERRTHWSRLPRTLYRSAIERAGRASTVRYHRSRDDAALVQNGHLTRGDAVVKSILLTS